MDRMAESRYVTLAVRGEKLDSSPVIDIHGHIGTWGAVWVPAGSAKDAIAAMDAIGVDSICVSAFLSIGPDPEKGNDMVGQAIRDYPGRIIGYAAFNPNYPETVVPELDRCFDELGMLGLKFHPDQHKYPADGPSYKTALDFAAARKAFVLSHHWGRPEILEDYAKRYPEVRFIVAHHASLGASFMPAQSWGGLIRDLPNVYADIASSLAPMGDFEAMVDYVGPKKVLYGSDAQLHEMGAQIGRVLFARLGDEEKADILGRNAARVIGL
jgi:predicted TIM-barrel fold metal-dependent hydrolase